MLHLPFSPPLQGLPQVHCEMLEDIPGVRVAVTARHTYGLRLEARRTRNLDTKLSVPVWFQITSNAREQVA